MATKQNFSIISSNYTTEIISDNGSMKYITSEKGNGVFYAFAMLKKDVSNFIPPAIDERSLSYYTYSLNKSKYIGEVIAIDIKNAYPTTLLNNSLITEKTFNALVRLPKNERLPAIGMLAGRKLIMNYKKGVFDSRQIEVNPLSGFFFSCVKTISEIIFDMQVIADHNFRWSWVDCIYLNKGDNILTQVDDIKKYLDSKNYKYTIETLTNVDVKEKEDHFHISYTDTDGESTFLNLPKSNGKYARDLISMLNTKALLQESKINFG